MTERQRQRYAVCGLSNRGLASFVLPLLGKSAGGVEGPLGYGADTDDISHAGDVVAILDPDAARVAEFNAMLADLGTGQIQHYPPDRFGDMVDVQDPTAVLVTSPDHTHAQFISAALGRGLDVVTEKPMVATAAEAREVLGEERASAGSIRVAHNLRYTPTHQRIKELVLGGAVGTVTRIAMTYHVDTRHGASYFLRWNRVRRLSGGLSVHKCCHHFDLLNWWVGRRPLEIFGYGALNHYGPRSPHRPMLADGTPCPPEQIREHDPYFAAQRGSGTFPDEPRQGLFGLHYPVQYPADKAIYLYDDEIDIEDTYSAVISYQGGASATYSIDFSSPWEGYRLMIAGTDGSLEVLHGRTVDGTTLAGSDEIMHRPLFAAPETIVVPQSAGGHAGADPLMRRDLFLGSSTTSQRLGLVASSVEAAEAVALGEGLWRSVTEHRPVSVAELIG